MNWFVLATVVLYAGAAVREAMRRDWLTALLWVCYGLSPLIIVLKAK